MTTITHDKLTAKKAFTTTILKVTRRLGASGLVLESHPDLTISLGSVTAGSLGFGKGVSVTLTPNKEAGKHHYTIALAEGAAPATGTKPTKVAKGSSPAGPFTFSRRLP